MIFHLVFILGTKVQSINAHPMTQVPMTLTKSQGQNFPKWVKWLATGHILDAFSPIDFIISIITAFCDSFGRCPLVPSYVSTKKNLSRLSRFSCSAIVFQETIFLFTVCQAGADDCCISDADCIAGATCPKGSRKCRCVNSKHEIVNNTCRELKQSTEDPPV